MKNIDTLEVIWKRINRQGRYYDKPMKYSEFKLALNLYIEGKIKEARIAELEDTLLYMPEYSEAEEIIEARIKELEG